MEKGIILFDIKDFLYQGLKSSIPDTDLINKKQIEVLNIIHEDLMNERDRRLAVNREVPIVDMFLPTGDGYYMLCDPDLEVVLDIVHCIMLIMKENSIKGYFVAHIGEIHLFKDMTGRDNATGFDIGYASRLQAVSRNADKLVCSKKICDIWKENKFFNITCETQYGIAKDGLEYSWKYAELLART